jgi:hypothetical protein
MKRYVDIVREDVRHHTSSLQFDIIILAFPSVLMLAQQIPVILIRHGHGRSFWTLESLRERSEEIPLLVGHLVEQFGRRMGKAIDSVPADPGHIGKRGSE